MDTVITKKTDTRGEHHHTQATLPFDYFADSDAEPSLPLAKPQTTPRPHVPVAKLVKVDRYNIVKTKPLTYNIPFTGEDRDFWT